MTATPTAKKTTTTTTKLSNMASPHPPRASSTPTPSRAPSRAGFLLLDLSTRQGLATRNSDTTLFSAAWSHSHTITSTDTNPNVNAIPRPKTIAISNIQSNNSGKSHSNNNNITSDSNDQFNDIGNFDNISYPSSPETAASLDHWLALPRSLAVEQLRRCCWDVQGGGDSCGWQQPELR
eukprot:CAMPEP_0206484758 /NCGR_PEP_ID=MMETSP0324_2-20121206/40150_1 /ASSEMBLY_ACC=CAM_ASM_000836 /TAXON_ID=2866 /ORGANISM="Crypthecodinium cohnii, Strain Seligo" /LENGTH=178 /DNA_ID=CAMNT_0053962937 /DNA_START=103 /DNA_END=635 /DNA_ORIENTATION=+